MVVGSRPLPLRGQPSDSPWQYNAVFDNDVGLATFGLVVNFDGGPAPYLCVSSAGRAPSFGEPHMIFPSDALSPVGASSASSWRVRDPRCRIWSLRARICSMTGRASSANWARMAYRTGSSSRRVIRSVSLFVASEVTVSGVDAASRLAAAMFGSGPGPRIRVGIPVRLGGGQLAGGSTSGPAH